VIYCSLYVACSYFANTILRFKFMQPTAAHNEKIAKMTFATVYPLYLAKLERKVGRWKKSEGVKLISASFSKARLFEFELKCYICVC
jgi:hypothetical protein